MNAFLKKEIRLLLPNLGFACLLALAGFFIPSNNPGSFFAGANYFITCVFCPAVVVMLALSPFGIEVGSGTFSNLLSQPVSRQKIWETKAVLLAIAMLAVALLWATSFLFANLKSISNHGSGDWLDMLSAFIVTGLVIYSGGLWTVLLLRQVAAAFWFTLIVPGALLAISAAVFSGCDGNFFEGVLVSVSGIYSLAGFFFARWLFFRAQDVQWSGGNIVMPEVRGLARFRSADVLRQWRPRTALWRKEFSLHQSQLVMAFVLLVLHGGVLVARQFVDSHKSPDAYFVLQNFWSLWLVMSLLVGCAAVAEERKIGTHAAQLCLPVKRGTEFSIKLAVVFGLSLAFGVVMPLLLEGPRILPGLHWEIGTLPPGWEQMMSSPQKAVLFAIECVRVATPLLAFALISLIVCFVSFYVSTLARNTLQTLAPAVVGIMFAWMLVFGSFAPWGRSYGFLWNGPIGFLVGLPVLALAVLALAFWNFKLTRPDLRTGGRNLLVFVGALVLGIVMTSAVYHRFWEKFSRYEPAHGAARLTLANPARLELQYGDFSVRLPDGKIWRSWLVPSPTRDNPVSHLFDNFKAVIAPGKFFGDTNWLTVQRAGRELVGLKNDGTLWVSEIPEIDTKQTNRQWSINGDAMERMVQFGTDSDWNGLAGAGSTLSLLTKTNGTLWLWGVWPNANAGSTRTNWPGLRAFTPRRFGTESNWAGLSRENYRDIFYKTDGSGWTTGNWDTNSVRQIEIEGGFVVQSAPGFRRGAFSSVVRIQHWLGFMAGIAADGSFRIFADEHLMPGPHNSYGYYYGMTPADYQIGTGSNWLAVAGGWEKVVTLKNDGTLWLWDFRPLRASPGQVEWDGKTFAQEVQRTVPVQLGSHTDWIAIAGDDAEVFSLAADGTLWYWPLHRPEDSFNSNGNESTRIPPLLDISRKPQLLGNVFATAP